MNDKTYKELINFQTLESRFDYLKLDGTIGDLTFGHNRWINQNLYKSASWKSIRRKIIIRDQGCDLGIIDFPIFDLIIVHHINPISVEDIEKGSDKVYDLNNLICCSKRTHDAIHFGNKSLLPTNEIIIRKPGDTKLW